MYQEINREIRLDLSPYPVGPMICCADDINIFFLHIIECAFTTFNTISSNKNLNASMDDSVAAHF